MQPLLGQKPTTSALTHEVCGCDSTRTQAPGATSQTVLKLLLSAMPLPHSAWCGFAEAVLILRTCLTSYKRNARVLVPERGKDNKLGRSYASMCTNSDIQHLAYAYTYTQYSALQVEPAKVSSRKGRILGR